MDLETSPYPFIDYSADFVHVSDSEIHDEVSTTKNITPLDLPSQAPQQKSNNLVRVVRSKNSHIELRLISVQLDSKHSHFCVEDVVIAPYSVSSNTLLRKQKKTPMNKSEAHLAFDKLIEQKFPSITLKSGKTLSTHLNIL